MGQHYERIKYIISYFYIISLQWWSWWSWWIWWNWRSYLWCTHWFWCNNNSRWFRSIRRRIVWRWSWIRKHTWLLWTDWYSTTWSLWCFRCFQSGASSWSLSSTILLNLIVDRSASRMNKLFRQTERQEVSAPLVKNMSVANDSLLILLLYLRSFIYISFYTHFVLAHFILHHFISFYIFIILFLVIVLCLSYLYVHVSFASLCMCKRSDRCTFLSVFVCCIVQLSIL